MRKKTENKIPKVPNLRFNEFTNEWSLCIIKNNYKVLMCKRIFAEQTKEYGDVPFYKIGTLGGKPDAFISNELFEEYKEKYNYPLSGETLITCSGTVGKCIKFDGNPAYYQDSNIVWLHPESDAIHNSFLNILLNNYNWNYLNSTTITRIYTSDLLNIKLYYPTLTEQLKLIKFFDWIDKRINTQSKIIDKLESLLKIISHHFFSNLKGKEITLSSIANIYQPKTIAQSDCIDTGLYNVFGANGIIGKYNKYNHEKNQICITCRGSTSGNVFMTEHKSWITGNAMVINVDENLNLVNKTFLYYFLSSMNFKNIVSGSGQPQIVREPLMKIKIILPPMQIQVDFEKMINTFFNKLQKEKDILSLYKKQKAYLLQNMFI